MRALLLRALDDAIAAHIVKLFNVLATDPNDAAVQRFEVGLGLALVAHDRLHKLICEKCAE